MDECECGRPLWDGALVCEACIEANVVDERRYLARRKLDQQAVSGFERTHIRKKLARLGRGYDQ